SPRRPARGSPRRCACWSPSPLPGCCCAGKGSPKRRPSPEASPSAWAAECCSGSAGRWPTRRLCCRCCCTRWPLTPSQPPGEGGRGQDVREIFGTVGSGSFPLSRSGGGGGRGGQGVRGLLTLAVFALLNAGHPETILHVSILAGLFALSRLLGTPRGERLRLVRTWSVAAGLGLGLAAPALLPAAHALPESLRAGLLAERRERILHEGPLDGWRT